MVMMTTMMILNMTPTIRTVILVLTTLVAYLSLSDEIDTYTAKIRALQAELQQIKAKQRGAGELAAVNKDLEQTRIELADKNMAIAGLQHHLSSLEAKLRDTDRNAKESLTREQQIVASLKAELGEARRTQQDGRTAAGRTAHSGGIEPALGRAPAGAGPARSEHSDSRTLTLAYLYSTRFPVPHRQSPPSRLSNLNKTPLMTSARKFKLRMTTRQTITTNSATCSAISR